MNEKPTLKKGITIEVSKNPKGKIDKFKNLTTGDVFHFSDESTDYLVCYGKFLIPGNDILEKMNDKSITRAITPSMMDRDVFVYHIDSILIY